MSAVILAAYYDAFNRRDREAMLALLCEDVVHEPSQGSPRHGRGAFREFLQHMDRCYRERVIEPVYFLSDDGTRGAAEFALEGTYIATDDGLPAARGQAYHLRVGAFFAFRTGQIARVSNHYNLADWIAQVR